MSLWFFAAGGAMNKAAVTAGELALPFSCWFSKGCNHPKRWWEYNGVFMNRYRIYSLAIQHSYGLDGPFKLVYILRIVNGPYQIFKFPGSKPKNKPTPLLS